MKPTRVTVGWIPWLLGALLGCGGDMQSSTGGGGTNPPPGGGGTNPPPGGGGTPSCIPACTTGYVCRSGRCEVDSGAVWVVGAVDGRIAEKKPDGSSWDSLGGMPDPFVCVAAGGERRCTSPRSDTLQPRWNEDLLMTTAHTLLSSGLRVSLWDEDIASHDPICGEGLLSVSESTLRDGTLSAGCQVASVRLSLRIR